MWFLLHHFHACTLYFEFEGSVLTSLSSIHRYLQVRIRIRIRIRRNGVLFLNERVAVACVVVGTGCLCWFVARVRGS